MLLSVSDITKDFSGGTRALDGLSFEVREGAFISLLGPSGCGKSTALRLIAGLTRPDRGTIAWPAGKPSIGFVFQDATLMPWATALTNVRLPLDLRGEARTPANARAMAALDRVGLADFARAYPRQLSGGMKMRVSIARALVARPRLLLMDEPFAALDEPSRAALDADLLRLWREDALTVLFVTHSVRESVTLSGRVLVFSPRPGRIKADIVLADGPRQPLTPAFLAMEQHISAALPDVST